MMSSILANASEPTEKKRKFEDSEEAGSLDAKRQKRQEKRQRKAIKVEKGWENVQDNQSQKRRRKKGKSAKGDEKKHEHVSISPTLQKTSSKKEKKSGVNERDKRQLLREQQVKAVLKASNRASKKPRKVNSRKPRRNSNLEKEKLERIQSWAEYSSSEPNETTEKKAEVESLSLSVSRPNAGWTLSPPAAGRYLDQDPVFVQDADGQDYLISANDREAQLLSLETSLAIHMAAAPAGRIIVCFAAGMSDKSIVRVGLDDGTIWTWDWQSNEILKPEFKAPVRFVAMAAAWLPQQDLSALTYVGERSNHYGIYVKGTLETLSTEYALESIQVAGNFEYIVAHGPSHIVIGTKKDGELDLDNFTWTQIPLTSTATCIHTRLLPVQPPMKKNKPQRPGLSLAIGNSKGEIHLYDDISSIFGHSGKPQLPTARTLHWHREAVSSVKFSQDGNYLVSGGKETVLVLWQLQTAKKQFLPHLTSTINRIVVNPKGDRYALQMGDNSIMVLSTSELKPVANFAGLQMSTNLQQSYTNPSSGLAAALHPRHPNQLLLSVPPTLPRCPTDISARAFLQIFDLATSRHIARQALTRNNVTDFNLGPEGTPITPPDVTHLRISQDGSWLATVDEWTPPDADLEHLVSDSTGITSLRQSRRETHLKFWHWDEQEDLWTLTTRVDSPHSNDASPGRTLALVSDPSTNSFASLGSDASVKIWKPKKRIRYGVPLKDRADAALLEWTCRRSIRLPRAPERVDSPFTHTDDTANKPAHACLSYAPDGSMLAAALTTDSSAAEEEEGQIVHFLNPSSGASLPKPGLTAHGIVALGFLSQYFIAVDAAAAYVWDLVGDAVVYKIAIDSRRDPGSETAWALRLSVDTVGGTFALTTRKNGSGRTKVRVFRPQAPICLFERKFAAKFAVEAVLAGSGRAGYVLLFSDATVCALAPAMGVSGRMRRAVEAKLASGDGGVQTPAVRPANDAMEEDVDVDETGGEDTWRLAADGEEDDRPVVRPEQLAGIFDAPQSFALPPVRDMFEAVVELFGRRPYGRPAVEVA